MVNAEPVSPLRSRIPKADLETAVARVVGRSPTRTLEAPASGGRHVSCPRASAGSCRRFRAFKYVLSAASMAAKSGLRAHCGKSAPRRQPRMRNANLTPYLVGRACPHAAMRSTTHAQRGGDTAPYLRGRAATPKAGAPGSSPTRLTVPTHVGILEALATHFCIRHSLGQPKSAIQVAGRGSRPGTANPIRALAQGQCLQSRPGPRKA